MANARTTDSMPKTEPKTETASLPLQASTLPEQSRSQLSVRARALVSEALAEPGQSLAPRLQTEAGQQLGFDFGKVQIHQGPRAAESARALGAHAYTLGRHIVFAQGRHAPHCASGRELLFHELAHAAQADCSRGLPAPLELELGLPDSLHERHADAMAQSAAPSGQPAHPKLPAHLIARRVDPEAEDERLEALMREQQARLPKDPSAPELIQVQHKPSGLTAKQTNVVTETQKDDHVQRITTAELKLIKPQGGRALTKSSEEEKRIYGKVFADKGRQVLNDGTVLPRGKSEIHEGTRQKEAHAQSINDQAVITTDVKRSASGLRSKVSGLDEDGKFNLHSALGGTKKDDTKITTVNRARDGGEYRRAEQRTLTRSEGEFETRIKNRGTEHVNLDAVTEQRLEGKQSVVQSKSTEQEGQRIDELSSSFFKGRLSSKDRAVRQAKGYEQKLNVTTTGGRKDSEKTTLKSSPEVLARQYTTDEKQGRQLSVDYFRSKPGAPVPTRLVRQGTTIASDKNLFLDEAVDKSADYKSDETVSGSPDDSVTTKTESTGSRQGYKSVSGDQAELTELGGSYTISKETQRGLISNFLRKSKQNYGWFTIENALQVSTLQGRKSKASVNFQANVDQGAAGGELSGAIGSINTTSDEVTIRDNTLGLFVKLKAEGEAFAGIEGKVGADIGATRGAGVGAGVNASAFAGFRLKAGGTITMGLEDVVIALGSYTWTGSYGAGGTLRFEARYVNGLFVMNGNIAASLELGLGAAVELRLNPRALGFAVAKRLGTTAAAQVQRLAGYAEGVADGAAEVVSAGAAVAGSVLGLAQRAREFLSE